MACRWAGVHLNDLNLEQEGLHIDCLVSSDGLGSSIVREWPGGQGEWQALGEAACASVEARL